MPDRLKVLIYGKSLFLDGIEAGLRDDAGLAVRRAAEPGEIPKGTDRPDVVLLDLDRTSPGALAALLAEPAGPVAIGLSLAGNKAILLSGEPRAVGTVGDLRAVIAEQVGMRDRRRP